MAMMSDTTRCGRLTHPTVSAKATLRLSPRRVLVDQQFLRLLRMRRRLRRRVVVDQQILRSLRRLWYPTRRVSTPVSVRRLQCPTWRAFVDEHILRSGPLKRSSLNSYSVSSYVKTSKGWEEHEQVDVLYWWPAFFTCKIIVAWHTLQRPRCQIDAILWYWCARTDVTDT